MILSRLDSTRCRELNEIRPYDLVVLQYGLNIVSDSVLQYGWYAKRMEEAVRHVRVCFPDADILMLGVSDRSRQVDGTFETMPAVISLATRTAAGGPPFGGRFLECLRGDGRREQHDPLRGEQLGQQRLYPFEFQGRKRDSFCLVEGNIIRKGVL